MAVACRGNARLQATDVLLGYLNDQSSITRTFALQALADLAEDDSRRSWVPGTTSAC